MFQSKNNSPQNSQDPPSAPLATPQIPTTNDITQVTPQNPTSKATTPHQKPKLAILLVSWIILLGLAVGLAILTKPAPNIIYANPIDEAYKFSTSNSAKVTEIVDDLDYYGNYQPNPLIFSPVHNEKYNTGYKISGLKNKNVEEKINQRIEEAADDIYNSSPEHHLLQTTITANYFNILSLTLTQYDHKTDSWRKEFLNFDLNTGNEISFDDLFPENLDLTPIFYKSFYDGLSEDIQFKKLFAKRRLNAENYSPDPRNCQSQYCPRPNETYDSLRALISDYDNKIANIEQVAFDAIQDYLKGEKAFYLNSYGPSLALSEDTIINIELKDNIRYATYLKKYRSANSIYENNFSTETNPFFTESASPSAQFYNEETDSYLFDYTDTTSLGNNTSSDIRSSLREYIKTRGLSLASNSDKFYHILARSDIRPDQNIYVGQTNICVYETSKAYYDSAYKKALIDKKAQGKIRYDENQVSRLTNNDDDPNGCNNISVIITKSGDILDDVDEILVNPSNTQITWQEYLKQNAYQVNCERPWHQLCYSDEEKASHHFSYSFNNGNITVILKESPDVASPYFWIIELKNIPTQYINPKILPD